MSTQRTRSAIYRSGRLPRMAKLKGMEKNHRMAMAERSRRRHDQQTTKLRRQPSQQDVLSVKFLHLLCAGFTEQRRGGNHEELAEESQPDDKREQEEHQPEELQHEAEGQSHQKEDDDDNPGESSDEEESSCEEEKNNDWEGTSCKRSRRESMGECSPVILASIDQDDNPKKKQKKTQAPSVCSSPGASPESGDSSQEQLDSFHRIYFPQPQEPLHPEAPVVGAEQPPCPGLPTESEVLPSSMDDALSCFPLSYPWDFDEQFYFHHHDAQNYSAYHGNSHNDADFLVVESPVRSHQDLYLQPLLMLYQQQEGGEAAAELTPAEEEFMGYLYDW